MFPVTNIQNYSITALFSNEKSAGIYEEPLSSASILEQTFHYEKLSSELFQIERTASSHSNLTIPRFKFRTSEK
ncbi:MAG: hypothetical protein IJV27_08030 [Prevotella sp.]|nr:hypothetical protein [Prevotella sp.]